MAPARHRHGGETRPREWESVDATSPDWPGATIERYEGADSFPRRRVVSPESLRTAARRRLRAARRGRRARRVALEDPWRERRLQETAFCVIDFETTGGGREQDDEILEMGAVLVSDGTLGREFSTLVDARRPITPAAQAVHGITRASLQGAPVLPQALPWLLEMTRGRVLVFHNARFDLPFLQRALCESQHALLRQPVLDTVVFARHVLGPPCGLGILGERLGLPVGRLHRALDDARLTAHLLVALLQLVDEAGWRDLADLPGLSAASPSRRARRRPRIDPLVQRLETAAARRESLHVMVHVGAGVAPVTLRLVPLRIISGGGLLAEDAEAGTLLQLDLQRITAVRRAP